jgi:hypothetical protein
MSRRRLPPALRRRAFRSRRAEKPPSSGQPPALPPDAQSVADRLVELTACPRARANRVIGAVHEDYYPSYLKIQIIKCKAYVCEHGRNIVSVGHFIASKIEHGEAAPDWVKLDTEDYWQVASLKLAWKEEAGDDDGVVDEDGDDDGEDDDAGPAEFSAQDAVGSRQD